MINAGLGVVMTSVTNSPGRARDNSGAAGDGQVQVGEVK